MQIGDCKLRTAEIAGGAGRLDWPGKKLVHYALFAGLALLAFTAATLCWRRMAGALAHPLEPAALVAAAVSVAATAAAIRLGLRRHAQGAAPPGVDRSLPWIVTAGVVVLGVALSLPGTSRPGLALFWAILAGEELFARLGCPPLKKRSAAAQTPADSDATASWAAPRQSGPRPATPEELDPDRIPAADILQQLIRRRAADGGETLSGWLRIFLAAGQRTANIHVAFCPPFPRSPQVAVDQLDGPAARIKKVQVLPYGARLDLKLAELSSAPAAVVLQFSALSGPRVPSAAQSEGLPAEGRDSEPTG